MNTTARTLAEAEAAAHVCTPETCPTPGRYYVTAIDIARASVFYMAGPYATHAEALANVRPALTLADKHDPRAWFMAWGTARFTDDSKPAPVAVLVKHGIMTAPEPAAPESR